MRSRRSTDAAWSEAAARRLAQLTADLGGAPPAGSDDHTRPREDWWADHTRVAQSPAAAWKEALAPDPDPPEPAGLPQPGRHAARRRRSPAWRPATPALPALGAAQVAVVAVLAAVGLAATAWWVARDHAQPVQAVPVAEASPLVPQPTSTATAASAAASGPAGTGSAGAQVTVDVTGKVRRPGIVVLDAGARVVDAVKAAGGARPGIDLASLNLARLLVDGEQIVVGQPAVAPPAAASGAPGGSAAPSGPTALVNLNLATEAELESLPEVGPVTAQAIIAWRDAHGGFTSVDELLEVDGIGEATLAQVTPYVTV
ncbi:helix-hairpin-helix domain-containing protein [Nocardioides panacisoli]|uniref:Helix-hairpin-helix DNA-binding motif class 1 domain-containing protein n=1 Tax=Nocardioides panacisoli TaxID=627624 RepID=A0ABP7IYS9_9ACTN